MIRRGKYRFFGVFSIIVLCIGLTFKYLQLDTFYSIKLGEFLSAHSVDFLDHYCWIAKLPYTYPHWLYDLFLYYVYHYFGYMGIYVSTIILFIILGLCLYYIHLKLNKNEVVSIIISIICVFQLTMFAVARAQLISLICFVLEFYWITRLIDTGQKKYILYLLGICLLVANVHATVWLFYFILFLPFLGQQIVYFFIKKYKKNIDSCFKIIIDDVKNFKYLLIAFVISLFGGLLSPSRICYTYIFRVMLGNSQHVLSEHLPLTIIEHPFFIVAILITLIILIFTKTKIYLHELFMMSGLLLMSFVSVRHLSFFYTIGLIEIGIVCSRCLKDCGDHSLDILGSILINYKFVYVFVLMIILAFSIFRYFEHSKEEFVLKEKYPIGASKYIKENLDYKNIKLYNQYNYGSYLLFQGIPVFIDARCDLYLKEFNGMEYSIFDELSDIEYDYEERFDYYGVDYALLPKKSIFSKLLTKDHDYRIIYQDQYFVLFERSEVK